MLPSVDRETMATLHLLTAGYAIKARRDRAHRLSPRQMADRLALTLDDWQTQALDSTARRMLFNVARQGGKSLTAAVLALHQAVYRDDALVLIVSPSERQSKLLMDKLMAFYRQLSPDHVSAVVENVFSLRLSNGSQVVALPGKPDTIRGFSAVDLLVVDEAAWVPDALYAAVRPMLAVSGGRLVAMSTPAGQRGWWHEAWTSGGDDWERYEIPAWDCPRISRDFLEAERRALPRLIFQAEYECQFVETADTVFARADIDAALVAGLPFVRLFSDDELAAHDAA